METGYRQKRTQCHDPLQGCDKGTSSDPHERENHERNNCGLETAEHRRDPGLVPEAHIDDAQCEKDEHRWQNKERSGGNAALPSVQLPSDVNGKLLSLRPRQHHAVTQHMKEMAIADPFLLFD